jgi:hypothetical protein
LTKGTVQEAQSPLKNLVKQRYAEGFNSGVKGLKVTGKVLIMRRKYYLAHFQSGYFGATQMTPVLVSSIVSEILLQK